MTLGLTAFRGLTNKYKQILDFSIIFYTFENSGCPMFSMLGG